MIEDVPFVTGIKYPKILFTVICVRTRFYMNAQYTMQQAHASTLVILLQVTNGDALGHIAERRSVCRESIAIVSVMPDFLDSYSILFKKFLHEVIVDKVRICLAYPVDFLQLAGG